MFTAKSILKRYIIALSLIALFITFAFGVSQYSHISGAENASIIDISGRQRMLSQRIALLATQGKSEELQQYITLFERSHKALLDGDINLEISGKARRIAQDIYFEKPYELDQHVMRYIQRARSYTEANDPVLKAAVASDLYMDSQGALLEGLDMVVQTVERYDIQSLNKLRLTETVFYLAAIVLLMLEIRLIFWPIYQQVKQSLEEKKLLEETQIALNNANAELEEFAYRTSHDLRSPLISSITLLDLIKRFMEKGQEDKAMHGIKSCKESLSKLEVLIQDILTLSRAANLEQNFEDINFDHIINDAFDKISHLDGAKETELIKNYNIELIVNSQKEHVRLILENLISNAIKYRNTDSIKSFIKVSVNQENERLHIDIQDNGIGIPEDQEEKLFAMFKRFHPKTSFGSGLGLYMIKKSAEKIGGSIEFIRPEQGSTFRLTIPSLTNK